MQKHEIVRAERFDGSLRFPLVIRIVKPRSAFDIDRFEAGIDADSFDQVYRRNHYAAADSVTLHQRLHLRAIARRPRPNAVRRIFSGRFAGQVDRMVFQQCHRTFDQFVQLPSGRLSVGVGGPDQNVFVGSARHVVRRRRNDAFASSLDFQQVPI